ncbi:proline--tRNA ligase [Coxiella endosymbiont of Amblyomma americanum]|uniref:proline--tRNA ligase n=1 Tax=Coxiella endosymbiont of Amblyomma americanum TaxID=325775 RepID=UPI00057E9D32|nr:proline--tRNA ligase [Coxiella endosymbiont of Amblyomma americanum]AJC50378.1 proline--tRNA ligase [Coxiella endosymbiont of Amblyomma americanum]AUJ58720.1 proline--tRNA ligase [Coxiella-like endosymbiont of Amblyomma americanum]
MKSTKFFFSTIKEIPSDTELISYHLMIRSGMLRKLVSGLYTWLPLGLRVLRKVEHIIREEMSRSGVLELLMPIVQPASLWRKSNRWDTYGSELLKTVDRHNNAFCFGPTHEEVITNIIRKELRSYKQLPVVFYQIQTKFRDEIRPRFGVIRSREFLMQDAYSFDLNKSSMRATYNKMYDTYIRIFTRLGLNFRAVLADTGAIGGNYSHEFQALANVGEDVIVYSNKSNYAANIEKASAQAPEGNRDEPTADMIKITVIGVRTIKELAKSINVSIKKVVKTLIVKGKNVPFIALILRGDHELNFLKAQNISGVASPLVFATKKEILEIVGSGSVFLGPVNLTIPHIVDRDAAHLSDFCCGANESNFYFINVNWDRDIRLENVADLRKVVVGDRSPDGKGKLQFTRSIEIGQVFQLGEKYSRKMNATVIDAMGKNRYVQMGCYGIGVSRTIAAIIEQNHDNAGIIWPEEIAPFSIGLIGLNKKTSYRVQTTCERIYHELTEAGFEVFWDDREERPGVIFADIDLIGIPHRLVVSENSLHKNTLEYKFRRSSVREYLPIEYIIEFLKKKISKSFSL